MKAPFDYGKVISSNYFTNRTKEIKRLEQNFINHTHTILISPRRWGKSSLVKNATEKFVKKNKTFKVVHLDLFNVLNEEEFYKEFAYEMIKSTSNKFEEWIKYTKDFLGKVRPTISLSEQPGLSFDLDIGMAEAKKNYKEILELPESLAKEKKITLIVCIDEFQNIEKFSKDALAFQKKLRAVWQHHQNVVYCLSGSKRHVMIQLFESQNRPFYKFGDTFYLEKIKQTHWIPYIEKQFIQTNKKIEKQHCISIVKLMEEHPYYVQQLCQLVWLNTDKEVDESIIETSISDLLERNNALFQRDFELLTETQINFLKAMLNGEKNFSSKEILKRYNIGTSANVQRVINALEKKEIINKLGKIIEFADPAFAIFLKKSYHILR